VAAFVERLGSMLTDMGMARMPARVFVCLLASETGRLNSAELMEALQASPAAISGAVRTLIQLGLVGREREPGARRDAYRVYEDVWHEAIIRRDQILPRVMSIMLEGAAAVGADTAAADRLNETIAFFEFIQAEIPRLMDEWKARRAAMRAQKA
jgi:DNA-binding transcriptional regulator GbsR (MarR family)